MYWIIQVTTYMHGLIFMEQYRVIWNCYDEARESLALWYTIMYDTSDKINTSLLKFVLLYEHLIIYENWTTPPPTLNKNRKTQSNKIEKIQQKVHVVYLTLGFRKYGVRLRIFKLNSIYLWVLSCDWVWSAEARKPNKSWQPDSTQMLAF